MENNLLINETVIDVSATKIRFTGGYTLELLEGTWKISNKNSNDNTELLECVRCGLEKEVEKGTWAHDKEMCDPCYMAYQGG